MVISCIYSIITLVGILVLSFGNWYWRNKAVKLEEKYDNLWTEYINELVDKSKKKRR